MAVQGDDEVWRRLANEIARGAEYDSNERRPFSRCLPGTRVELLTRLDDSLAQQDNRFVWLFGGSGSGKSSVAYSTADHLRSTGRLATTFFFSRKDVSRSNTDRVFLTLAYQIGLLHDCAREAIVKAIRRDPDILSPQKSRRDQFEKLVAEPLRELQFMWSTNRVMVFDAADEVEMSYGEQLRDLIGMLAELLRDPTIPISSILCTSRISSHLQALTRHQSIINLMAPLYVESFHATEDIRLYLRHTFHGIYQLRDLEFAHSLPWPAEDIINTLVNQIQGQFIVAATVCRLVHDAPDPTDCLNVVSSMYRGVMNPLDLTLGSIDSVYRYIINSCELQDQQLGVECLADVIALASPLSLSNICRLFAGDVRKRVAHFSAIIFIPSMESSSSVQIYHTSLRDYLSTSSRSKNFHVDPAESHRRLAGLCLKLMWRELKKDMCGLEDPSKLHVEIPDFERKRDEAISGALRYACLYWPYHLQRMAPSSENQALVARFLHEQLPFFLEALSVGGFNVGSLR
ncbi:hypothetical protein CONPUDRAFT_167383 [Coniophora puteana RWD-64-598 SS2]|uniref:Nephrocystin 3-like N-terminal domain-containing protein n=1 Tax=Coniophora puteana (strain RWD-64-598) TaxID=741705 RepID=A0A5M3MHE2_CONPW|nr:uncharacterized protein CONPUDRAFT_167383 [Coniophora puteana RWD-64-598 SS2]EIW78360.1 hypothetical protein CONPUDRAFT_167383 [Coniophora puteana RWD-64-598 SS2]